MAVLLDAIGQSGVDHNPFFNGQQVIEKHNASGGNIAVLAALSYSAADLALWPFIDIPVTLDQLTRTVKYGGTSMVSLGVAQWGTTGALMNAWTEVFALLGVAPGEQDVQANVWGGVDSGRTLRLETVSYTGVASIGTPVITNGTGTTMAQSATVATNGRNVGVWGSRSGLYIPSGSTVAQRYLSNDVAGLLIGDIVGTGTSQTLSANRQNSGPWGGIVIPLQAADTVFSADVFVADVPWIAPKFNRLPRTGGLRRNVFKVPAH
ncbi:hypothetical protein OS122_02455 [Mycolicibacterium mucogenicum]|uniref:hypothetical protein n=1 Tax=Mycolicibacterium mucogenicum TaxID=56689 RepID=UPI002269CED0|nr:hypothetical protein [Mycolicibacterium mucogenicum]MCX8559760.1 hypothetical protein [Mycolicibacterium mucogenicum]